MELGGTAGRSWPSPLHAHRVRAAWAGGASQNSGTPEGAGAGPLARPNGCKCRGSDAEEIERLRVGGDKAGSGRFSDENCLGLSGAGRRSKSLGKLSNLLGNIPAWRSPA